MLFGKRDKKNQPNQRVLNLKARVDALRQADEATRDKDKTYTLDHFLEGDDVLTGRETEDHYTPTGFSASKGSVSQPIYDGYDVDLEAELQKYIERQESQAPSGDATSSSSAAPPAAGQTASQSSSEDWSWDAAPKSPPLPPAWPSEAAWGAPASPREPGADSAQAAWPEAPESAWPPSKEWPTEEAWPPRDEAV